MQAPSSAGRALGVIRQLDPYLLLAIAIAAVTRLGWLGLVEFQADESGALSIASTIARGQALPLVGIGSSLGIPNAPFFVYLLAIPELLTQDPRVATGMIGLLGTVAVAATYGLSAFLFDRITAATAALLYAVSPWGIVFSRKVWEQDALPLFVTLAFWAFLAAIRVGRRQFIAPGIILLTLATELHPTAFFLAVPAAIAIGGCVTLDWPEVGRSVWATVLGLVGAVIVEAPFLVWQIRHGWPLLEVVAHLAGDPATYDLGAISVAGNTMVGSGDPRILNLADVWGPAEIAVSVFLMGGLLLLLWRSMHGRAVTRLMSLTLLGWLIAPIALQIHHTVPVYPHYFIVLFPVCFIAMGVSVSWLTRFPVARLAAPAVVGAIVVAGLVAFGQYLTAMSQGAVQPAFGVPLGRQLDLIVEASHQAAGGPVYVGTHDSLAPTLLYLSNNRWRIFDDRRGLRLSRVSQTSVLISTDPTAPASLLASRWLARQQPSRMVLSANTTVVEYRLGPNVDESSSLFRPVSVAFNDGLTLAGYRVVADAAVRQIRVGLLWRFADLPPTRPPTVFTHLVDRDRNNIEGSDGLAYDPADWRIGELSLDEFDLPWPPGPGAYRVELGLYDYPSLERFTILNPDPGAPLDSFDLDPFEIGP